MTESRLYQFTAVSLIAHLVVWATMLRVEPPVIRTAMPIQVRYLESDEKKQPKVIRVIPEQDQLTEAVEKLNEQVDRIASSTRRAQEEQQAFRLGPNRNRNLHVGKTAPPAQTASQADRHQKTSPVQDANGEVPVVEAGIDKPMGTGRAAGSQRVQISDSSISTLIPEVRQGRFTSLDANQFEHYTFYARINEQISNRWTQHIRTFLRNIDPIALSKLAVRDQVTEFEVLLDGEGNFQDISFTRKADHEDLDVAAGGAVQFATPFLNPPLAMIDKDGMIRMRFRFSLLFSGSPYFASPRGDRN